MNWVSHNVVELEVPLNATVEDSTATSSTVAKFTVHGSKADTVSEITAHKNIEEDLSAPSLPKFTEIVGDYMNVMCSGIMQKTASCKERALALLGKRASPKTGVTKSKPQQASKV